MKSISIIEWAGSFAENKDVARDIRLREVVPVLDRHDDLILDFEGVDAATQSFIHALLSDVLRKYGVEALDHMEFKSCNIKVRKMIEIVVEYMQEGLGIERDDQGFV